MLPFLKNRVEGAGVEDVKDGGELRVIKGLS
jgi:hypothetical protein